MNFPDETISDLMDQTPANMPSKILMKQSNTTQTLSFPINDDNNSVEVIAQNVIVNSVGGNHNHGSSKIKLKNIVDYNWEHKLYAGQLLAVHMDGNFLAYGIKVPTSGSSIWWVRVTHPSSENRALIKGIKGQVHDLSFAFISTQVILGCIDEEGNIFIHNIELGTSGLACKLMLHIPGSGEVCIEHRIVWCPYIPDDDDTDLGPDEDCAKLLVTTQGNKVSIWNIGRMTAEYSEGSHLANAKPCMVIEDHGESIVDAAFSPDGSALATASRDGLVMFFQANFLQVYKHSDTPRCLHTWSPHDGKPLSCLFFLDNHNSYNTEQFWKHAVTGTDNNSILKIWSCKSWVCLQTITFTSNPEFPHHGFKAGLDKSASYLLLSDIYRKILFILQLDNSSDDSGLLCKSISEFFLPYPILSFGVADAGMRTFKCPSSCSDPFHQPNQGQSQSSSPIDDDHSNDENNQDSMMSGNTEGVPGIDGCNVCAVIRVYLVQPKSLQEGLITFSPPRGNTSIRLADLDSATSGYKDDSADVSLDKDLSSISIPHVEKFAHDNENGNERKSSIPAQPNNSILAQQSQQLKNLLMHNQSLSMLKPEVIDKLTGVNNFKKPPSPTLLLQTTAVSVSSSQPPINLMTPDAFSSPAKRDEEDPPIAHSPDIRLPTVPLLDNDINLLNTPLNIDAPIILNPDPVIPLANSSRVFPLNPPQPAVCDAKFASGGSSPSREVQEILSLKGSDCFYEDDLEEDLNSQSPRIDAHISPGGINLCQSNPDQSSQEGFQLYNAPDKKMYISPRIDHPIKLNSSKRSTGSVEASPTQWPSIDMAKINEANQRKANSDKSSIHSKSNNNLNLSATMDMSENEDDGDALSGDDINKDPIDDKKVITKQNGQIKSVLNQLKKLVDILNDQQIEISLLRGEVSAFRRQQNTMTAPQNLDEATSTAKLVEQALQKNQIQLKQMIDSTIASRIESDRVNREALLSGVSQMMGAQMAERLSAVVSHETRTSLVPCVERVLEPFVRSFQLELARKLSATDHLLTENIQKLVNSKSVIDGICAAVAQTLNVSTKDAFKDVINTTLIPSMEKAHNQMFKQLNKSFSVGTDEYLSAFEGCTKRSLERANVINETCSQVNSVSTQLQHILDQQSKQHILNTQTQQAVKQLNSLTKELQSVISKTLQGAFENQMSPIRECIRDQISSGMAAHAAQLEDSVLLAVRSQSQTPAPTVIDMQTQQSQIEQLINTGQLNTAFQQALSASDLRLVVHACAYAEPRQVFSHPCPLQQNVLLSLIQQLGADMNSDTLLKHRYLEEAVMNLDQKNPVTREHMPAVLKELKKHLSVFISVNPYNEATHNLKVLILMTDGLIKSGGINELSDG